MRGTFKQEIILIEYFDNITLILSDCIELMPVLQGCGFELVVIDPLCSGGQEVTAQYLSNYSGLIGTRLFGTATGLVCLKQTASFAGIGCSDTSIYRLLGNGWTVEVIKHILSYFKKITKYRI